MNKKQEDLTNAVIKFEESKKTSDDFLELFIIASRVTRQGDGLVWSDVRECVETALNKGNEYKPSSKFYTEEERKQNHIRAIDGFNFSFKLDLSGEVIIKFFYFS